MFAVIGDEHGTGMFLDIYEEIKNRKDITDIYQVGDFFDPYEDISYEEMVRNFLAIIKIAKEDPRVHLCFGNHDTTYLIDGEETSRTDISKYSEIRKLLTENIDMFRFAYKHGEYVISHAGITNFWFNSVKDYYDIYGEINLDLLYCFFCYSPLDTSGYGDHWSQSCVWVRPNSLINDPLVDVKQIVGHTSIAGRIVYINSDGEEVKNPNDAKIIFCDTRGKRGYVLLD